MKFMIIFCLLTVTLAKEYTFDSDDCEEPANDTCKARVLAHLQCGLKIQEKFSEIVDAEDFDSDNLTFTGTYEGEEYNYTIGLDAIEDKKDKVDVTFEDWDGYEVTIKFVRVSSKDFGLPADICQELVGQDSVDLWLPKHKKIQKKIKKGIKKFVKKYKAGALTEKYCRKAEKQIEQHMKKKK